MSQLILNQFGNFILYHDSTVLCILDVEDTNCVRNTTQALQINKKVLIHFRDAKTPVWINMILIF